MTRKVIIILIASLLLFTGCNIFEWLYPDNINSEEASDLVSKGNTALQKGELKKAMDYFSKAVSVDSKNSEARWGYVQAYTLYNNVSLIMIASKISADEDPSQIITEFTPNLLDIMNVIISYLAPISEDKCDGVIPATDININGNLMLAYLIRGFLKNADSNGDGVYFSETGLGGGDVIIFDDSGNLTYNPNVVDIDNLQTQLDSLYSSLEKSVNDPSNNRLGRDAVSNIIVVTHDLTESLAYVYKIFGSSFDDFTKAASALDKLAEGLPETEVFLQFKEEVDERYNQMAGYLQGADIDANHLNCDHYMMVGTNMSGYDGAEPPDRGYHWTTYGNFNTTSFTTHSPIATTYETGKTNYYMRLHNHSGDYLTNAIANPQQFTNDLHFLKDLFLSVATVFTDIVNANLIKNISGDSF